MTKSKVEEKKVSDLIPDNQNINTHTQRGRGIVEHSVRKYGIGRGIVAAGKGTDTPQIIGGHLTTEIVGSLDMDDVIFVHTNGEKLVVTVRDDIAPNSAEAIALGLIDNESQKQSYNPDLEILATVMADPAMQALKDEDKILGDTIDTMYDLYRPKNKDEEILLDQAIQLLPAKEYIVVMCKDADDFQKLRELFNLQEVRRGGYKAGSAFDATGIQRVIHADTLFEVINARSDTK